MSNSFDRFYSKRNRDANGVIARKKAQTLFSNVTQTLMEGGVKPKGPDALYYGTLYVNPDSRCLVHADSYSDWLSAAKGKEYCSTDVSDSVPYYQESYQGSGLIADQSGVNVTDTVYGAGNFNKVIYPPPQRYDASGNTNSNWEGIITDPCGQLFGPNCYKVPFSNLDKGAGSYDFDLSVENITTTISFTLQYPSFPSGKISGDLIINNESYPPEYIKFNPFLLPAPITAVVNGSSVTTLPGTNGDLSLNLPIIFQNLGSDDTTFVTQNLPGGGITNIDASAVGTPYKLVLSSTQRDITKYTKEKRKGTELRNFYYPSQLKFI